MADVEPVNTKAMEPVFHRGEHTLKVPMELFANNRKRLVERLGKKITKPGTFIVLQGGTEVPYDDTDVSWPFKQESFFQWCFGVEEPDCFGAIDLKSGKSILFLPRLPDDYAIWMGKLHSLQDFQKRYAVNETFFIDEIATILKDKGASTLCTLSGTNSDSGLPAREAVFDGIEQFSVNNTALYPEICECRVIKSSQEIEVLRYVTKISSDAHKKVMKVVRPDLMEYQAEAAFINHAYSVGGCRHMGYVCICGSGHNSSVLHYGHAGAPNNKIIHNEEMCLFDMGAIYCGYTADITCSFPSNGIFSQDQKLIYEAVLRARDAVLSAAKPGVFWTDMHLLANREMLMALKNGGLLIGDVDEMIAVGLNEIFQPHGLGHLLGLDVHDVGGYLPGHPQRSTKPGLRKLRTARQLMAGMVITVEPGCYFIDTQLDAALADSEQSKFLVAEKINRFRGFGGVRIEDDVLITETGVENLTHVPRTVEEIEKWMSGDRKAIILPQNERIA
ncbi:xaa-Pro dipeptidase isoform X2 [Leptopilina heterotoma]|uniref:xaa-Pro dipeptidase isoform X2 n=1 Tax=Leptopilina heterotoma TaxID=63436 RepID=UPI001CA8311E|nr:xaa-Pro dipeptidase isoform X2 [Leptopilina heterotoma]XP_043473280.1 xaa-Pro dipeptidase isoform X2 [Leptopilina heterotoma]XP_043473281.1 xaa-Pro dipeptidase isoform X2 [Leptopilina heterotoma]XP_043473282.1 xaa-Pro dipeptidase isoform X2 [Leptopilina heterotoma]